MSFQRDDVVAALRAEDVAAHLGIEGHWRGRWMRSISCAEIHHAGEAFALARDGHWHCHSCDKGGDLLGLLALGAKLNIKDEFPALLKLAAEIAGLDDTPNLFGEGPSRPPRRERPQAPPQLPLPQRVDLAKRRAEWCWARLETSRAGMVDSYLRSRGLKPDLVREDIRSTPLRISNELRHEIVAGGHSPEMRTLWHTFGNRHGTLAVAFPVRHVDDGRLVDIRARRIEPGPDTPKIVGMVGNVTTAPAERGKMRQLIGCYGHPHTIDADHVVITEGALDYATALQVWPNAHVLSAVDAGCINLVAEHAARALAGRDKTSRLTIVEQADPPRVLKDGRVIAGAADASINEVPNSASKEAVRLLGPRRVGWLFCDMPGVLVGGKPVKDLNDLLRAGADIVKMHRWWSDVGDVE